MTRKKRRLYLLLSGAAAVGAAAALTLTALEDTITFFHGPAELAQRESLPDHQVRLGGLVAEDSVTKAGDRVAFTVTDGVAEVEVAYSGVVPDLFREGQGVVAEGHFNSEGVLQASTVLARHDENYMPDEVQNALERAGTWQHYQEDMMADEAGSAPAAEFAPAGADGQ